MTTIYLVRHAEAQGNIERRFQGHFDGKISENGEKQLLYLKKRFRKIPLNAVYTSPLSRAVATAEVVNFYSELPLILDRSLMEICGGAFEGQKYSDLPERFPEEWEHWDKEPHKFRAPGGESMRQCFERMKAVMHRIVHANMGHSVAVVSHGCALRNYLCFITDTPFEALDEIPWGDNTCVSRIDFDDRFKPRIVYLNDVSHLPEDLSTLAKQNWWRKDGSTDSEPDPEEEKLLHVDAGELYVRDDDMDITAGDLLTPQGPMPLNNVRLRVAEGTVYLRDDNIRLTKPPKKQEHTVVLEDDENAAPGNQEPKEAGGDVSESDAPAAETPEAAQDAPAVLEVSPEPALNDFVEENFERVSV